MPNKFVWHDLMTTDVAAAERFYAAVVGWKIEDSGMPGPAYSLLFAGEDSVGGIMAIPAVSPRNSRRFMPFRLPEDGL